jgi:hypothetical protein
MAPLTPKNRNLKNSKTVSPKTFRRLRKTIFASVASKTAHEGFCWLPNQKSNGRGHSQIKFEINLTDISFEYFTFTHRHLVCELHPYREIDLGLGCGLPISGLSHHILRFYHTRGHYPGHQVSFDLDLVAESLGCPRNLTVSPSFR